MWRSLDSQVVRIVLGLVPDSPLARVRRVLVHHMEDEDDQESEKEDEREGGKQRVERRVVENRATRGVQVTHEMKCATHLVLEPMSMRH